MFEAGLNFLLNSPSTASVELAFWKAAERGLASRPQAWAVPRQGLPQHPWVCSHPGWELARAGSSLVGVRVPQHLSRPRLAHSSRWRAPSRSDSAALLRPALCFNPRCEGAHSGFWARQELPAPFCRSHLASTMPAAARMCEASPALAASSAWSTLTRGPSASSSVGSVGSRSQ